MTKIREEPKVCVYCGKKATTSDHVPPKQIFPKPRPNNLEKIPACFECNNKAGKDEEYFLAAFMFSEAGTSEAGKKLWQEKLNRMYKKNLGLRRKIAQNLKAEDVYTPHGIFMARRMTINLDEDRIYKVVSKIIKGLYYLEYQEPLPCSQNLDCLFLENETHFNAAKACTKQLKNGSNFWKGIFQYKYNRTEKGRPGSIWLLNFYDFATFLVIASEPPKNNSHLVC